MAGGHWIKGKLPSNPAGTCSVDVSIASGGSTYVLPMSFCYLPELGSA